MATVLAPMLPKIGEKPSVRFACTHIANTAYVVEDLQKMYTAQVGREIAERDFFPLIETVRGNAAPKGETFKYVSKGYRS
jgi:hypothetical protein